MKARCSTAAVWFLAGSFLPVPAVAISHLNPFHSDQCERAIRYATARLGGEQQLRAEEILAEGLLCRGLAGDDWALVEAIGRLTDIVRRRATAVYPAVYLAEAWRRHAPASERALEAARTAIALLQSGEDSMRNPTLVRHLENNAAAMRRQRAAVIEFLERMEPDTEARRLSPQDLQRVVAALTSIGSAGRERARMVLENHRVGTASESRMETTIDMLAAGLDRGAVPVDVVAERFGRAARELCENGRFEMEVQICVTAEAQAAELHRIADERQTAVVVDVARRRE